MRNSRGLFSDHNFTKRDISTCSFKSCNFNSESMKWTACFLTLPDCFSSFINSFSTASKQTEEMLFGWHENWSILQHSVKYKNNWEVHTIHVLFFSPVSTLEWSVALACSLESWLRVQKLKPRCQIFTDSWMWPMQKASPRRKQFITCLTKQQSLSSPRCRWVKNSSCQPAPRNHVSFAFAKVLQHFHRIHEPHDSCAHYAFSQTSLRSPLRQTYEF